MLTWNRPKRGWRNTSMMLRWISVLMNCMLLWTIDLFWIFCYAKYNLTIICFDSGIFLGQMMFKLMLQVGYIVSTHHCMLILFLLSFFYSFLYGLYSKYFSHLQSSVPPSHHHVKKMQFKCIMFLEPPVILSSKV